MKPQLARRALLHAAVISVTWRLSPVPAIPPPKGSVYLLLPLVQQRLLLAECSAAIARPDANWTSLMGLLDGPPFTDTQQRGSTAVGNIARGAAAEYEGSLVYSRELSVDDLKQCFPRRDEDCIRLQMDSDRLYRGLLVNEVLGALQSVQDELGYLSSCERGVPLAGTSCPPRPISATDLDELTKSLSAAGSAFDRYFDVVPAADVRAAVEAVAKTSPRWRVTLLSPSSAEEGGGGSGAGNGGGSGGARSRQPMMCLVPNDVDAERELCGSGEQSDAPPPPTCATLVRFALPTLAAWLVSPLMSLVDTAVVGRESATLLAALGPATMIGDSMSYLCSFLGVATTNLVATAAASADDDDTAGGSRGNAALAHLFGSGARLALLCGLASLLVQLTFGRAVLTRYTSAKSAAVVAPAFEYVRIRALGAPAALLARVGSAACLALKDPLTPLLAVTMSGLLNLVLDVLLVSALNCGISGAAWATLASEVACAAIVLHAVRQKLVEEPQPAYDASRAVGLSSQLSSLLLSRDDIATYASFARPLILTTAGKIATYSSLAHVATTVSVAGTAAHRVLMCVYWFMWPFAETWSQVAQAFLPGSAHARLLMRRLIACGVAVGLLSACATAGVLLLAPTIFSCDAAVLASIHSLTPLAAACVATVGVMCSMEGSLLATRRLVFLSRFYLVNAITLVTAFKAVEHLGWGLHAAWSCMLAFSVVRVCVFGLALMCDGERVGD